MYYVYYLFGMHQSFCWCVYVPPCFTDHAVDTQHTHHYCDAKPPITRPDGGVWSPRHQTSRLYQHQTSRPCRYPDEPVANIQRAPPKLPPHKDCVGHSRQSWSICGSISATNWTPRRRIYPRIHEQKNSKVSNFSAHVYGVYISNTRPSGHGTGRD